MLCAKEGCRAHKQHGQTLCNRHGVSHMRGGSAYRQHSTFKAAILARDNHTCQSCGAPARDVAHIVPFSECHETRPDNVRALCHSCNQRERPPQYNARLPLDGYYAKLEAMLV